jgi:hypothetical protein
MRNPLDVHWYTDDLIPSDIIFAYDKSKIKIYHYVESGEKWLVIEK